ncbi:MAG TPA: hypothetical protein VMV57_06970 [Terracidiphilus sp.]|nr:hypothetical protein [Terracidiphilus sp.]
MDIRVNLATQPFADLRPLLKKLRITMGALAVAAVALGLALHAVDSAADQARARDNALEQQISAVRNERHGYEAMMQQPANAAVLKKVQFLNALFDEKAFSWTLAMEDLETVLPGGVQVTTLEPNREKDGHIRLRLRVLGPRDRSIELVKNLEHSRHFLEPRIVGESAETTNGPGQALQPVSASNRENFDLLAEYNPATPQEQIAANPKASGETGAHRSAHPRLARPKAPMIPRREGPR